MTATKRMTGKDYLKELDELEKSQKSLESHIKTRLKELIKKHPDISIGNLKIENLDGLSTYATVACIEMIEKQLEKRQKVKQLTIDHIYKEAKGKMDKALKEMSD
jgi:hypothetical protein